MTTFAYDLAVSAVSFDAALVTELFAELGPCLRTTPVWEGHPSVAEAAVEATLVADRSRLALVLHQRLWRHDRATKSDATELESRVRDHPESVCVMTLDDAPIPAWLDAAPRCDLRAAGLRGAADFMLEALESRGGSVKRVTEAEADAAPPSQWPKGPPPYLSQPRAYPALRRELDAAAADLKPELERRRIAQPDGTFELLTLPHRIIARLDEIAISFSWIAGRMGTVQDGRLLVIEWSGVAPAARGTGALKSATPRREHVYCAALGSAEEWRWRLEGPNGQAYSTANLVAEWLAHASLAHASLAHASVAHASVAPVD